MAESERFSVLDDCSKSIASIRECYFTTLAEAYRGCKMERNVSWFEREMDALLMWISKNVPECAECGSSNVDVRTSNTEPAIRSYKCNDCNAKYKSRGG